jgi:salicylate biosynthesis isochorismate synthase
MMEAFIDKATREISASGAALGAITVPAPVLHADRAARAPIPGSLLWWDSPARDGNARALSFVGFGEAARVEGNGEGRFDEIRRGAEELFAKVVERCHPEATFAPPPRLYGGVAFRPEPTRDAPWSAFRDASFALPRVLYGTDGERAFLRVVAPIHELVRGGVVEDALAAITAAGEARGARLNGHAYAAQLERTSAEVWADMIGDALTRIRAQEMTKVVPMALCKVLSEKELDPRSAIASLGAEYPDCVRFAFQRGDAVFLGASPERLVQKSGLFVEADGLAGSAFRRAEGDARAAAALLESDKDRREHRIVIDAIEAALAPISRELKIPGTPIVRTLRNVHHLWTPIAATLARPMHVLDLVRMLHPTPAVCGTPREAAIRWIAAHEPSTRGWYAGAVGWLDREGDGAFSVAIRSGVLAGGEAWLYAGAGIVEGSDPTLEYAETRTKQAPMLAALGLAP